MGKVSRHRRGPGAAAVTKKIRNSPTLPLSKPRQEAYAQALSRGAAPREAASAAGYLTLHYAEGLVEEPRIAARVAVLKAARDGGGSADTGALIDELIAIGRQARALDDPRGLGVARACLVDAARLKLRRPPDGPPAPAISARRMGPAATVPTPPAAGSAMEGWHEPVEATAGPTVGLRHQRRLRGGLRRGARRRQDRRGAGRLRSPRPQVWGRRPRPAGAPHARLARADPRTGAADLRPRGGGVERRPLVLHLAVGGRALLPLSRSRRRRRRLPGPRLHPRLRRGADPVPLAGPARQAQGHPAQRRRGSLRPARHLQSRRRCAGWP